MTTDFDRLLKISIGHNVTENYDLHDLIKTQLMRMYRRKYPNIKIYSEYNPISPNSSYPDIFVELDVPLILELQSQITSDWKNQINKKYPKEEYDLIIVPLKKVESDWLGQIKTDELINKIYNPVESLRKVLGEYLV